MTPLGPAYARAQGYAHGNLQALSVAVLFSLFRVAIPPWETRLTYRVIGDVVPLLRRSQHFA